MWRSSAALQAEGEARQVSRNHLMHNNIPLKEGNRQSNRVFVAHSLLHVAFAFIIREPRSNASVLE
jgi:hypothetical protein